MTRTYGGLAPRVVQALSSISGAREAIPYAPNEAQFLGWVSDATREFCSRSGVLFVESVALTLTVNQAEYALGSNAFARAMSRIDKVRIKGRAISHIGSSLELERWMPTWLTDASGEPLYWWMASLDTLRVHPKPSAVFADCSVQGAAEHPALEGEETAIQVPERHWDALAMFAAAKMASAVLQTEAAAIAMQKASAGLREIQNREAQRRTEGMIVGGAHRRGSIAWRA